MDNLAVEKFDEFVSTGLLRQDRAARNTDIAPEITDLMRTLAQPLTELRQCVGIFEGMRGTYSFVLHSITMIWIEHAIPARPQPPSETWVKRASVRWFSYRAPIDAAEQSLE